MIALLDLMITTRAIRKRLLNNRDSILKNLEELNGEKPESARKKVYILKSHSHYEVNHFCMSNNIKLTLIHILREALIALHGINQLKQLF